MRTLVTTCYDSLDEYEPSVYIDKLDNNLAVKIEIGAHEYFFNKHDCLLLIQTLTNLYQTLEEDKTE